MEKIRELLSELLTIESAEAKEVHAAQITHILDGLVQVIKLKQQSGAEDE